ncbi:MAG: carboxypeptidase-like regulatory domain-containing protein [Sphingobacterium sp.]
MSDHFDIDYLRRYVNGELDSAEMFAVEKASHKDQQLMDVILGLEEERRHQKSMDLRDLHTAIYQRTRPNRRQFPFSYWAMAVAASVLLALAIATIWYLDRDEFTEDQEYVEVDRSSKETDTTLNSIKLSDTSADFQQESSRIAEAIKSEKINNTGAVVQSPTNTEEEQREKDQVIEQIVRNSPGTFLKQHESLLKTDQQTAQQSSPNPRLTTVQQEHSAVIHVDRVRSRQPLSAYNDTGTTNLRSPQEVGKMAAGVVLDLQSGRPIANATVRDLSTNKVITTDSTGQYVLPLTADNQQLDILSIGYQNARVTASNNKIIHLTPDFQSLEEVVAVGYDSKVARINSVPLIGWVAYKKYINDQSSGNLQGKGEVTLLFDISSFGRPIEIQIKESSNSELNQKAVEIIRHGPDWKKGNDGKLIEVEIDFK